MNIGLDVSGGDFAPRVNLLGAVQANQALNDVLVFFFLVTKQIYVMDLLR